jgi:hypothetical protein
MFDGNNNITTTFVSEPSVRKQSKLYIHDYNRLKSVSDSFNQVYTKSIVADMYLRTYFVLSPHVEGFDDRQGRILEFIDGQLGSWTDSVKKIKNSDYEEQDRNIRMDSKANLQISPSVANCDEMSYNMHETISDAIRYVDELAFTSLGELIDIILQCNSYKEDGVEPDNDVAKAICLGDSENSYEGVEDANKKLLGNWWQDDDLTYEEIREWQAVDDNDIRLTNRDWKKRYEAFYNAFQNEPLREEEVPEKIGDIFDCESLEDDKAEEFDKIYNPDYVKVSDTAKECLNKRSQIDDMSDNFIPFYNKVAPFESRREFKYILYAGLGEEFSVFKLYNCLEDLEIYGGYKTRDEKREKVREFLEEYHSSYKSLDYFDDEYVIDDDDVVKLNYDFID